MNVNQIAAIAVKDYYAKMSEVSKDRSYWYGLGVIPLGYKMHDAVDPDALYALCALGKKAASVISAGEDVKAVAAHFETHQAELERPRRSGYDLTFMADKSAGMVFLGHPDENTRDATLLAHQLAVNASLRFLEQKVGFARVTEDDEVRIVKAEMIEAVFTHYTNRNLEPLLHSHVIVPNVVRTEDGEWRALHSDEIYRWYMTAGAKYRAAFREHMRRLTTADFTINGGWKSQITGLAEWTGPDGANLLKAYSRRRGEIEEELARLRAESPTGEVSPKLKTKLGIMTRTEKDFGDGDARIDEISAELRETLRAVWGLGDAEWNEILQLRPDPKPDAAVDGLWLSIPKHLAAYDPIPMVENTEALIDYMSRILFDEGGSFRKEGILAGRAYVSVQDIHKCVYDNFGGFVAQDVLEEAINGLLAGKGTDEKLRLKPLVPAVYVANREVPLDRVPVRYYAAQGVLNSESRVLQLASQKTLSAVLDEDVVNAYLTETIKEQRETGGFVLSEEQQDALRHLFTSETSATLLMGAQGAGKTTMFSHFSKLAQAHGVTVWGLAPTGTAAQKLGDTLRKVDGDARSMTIESFVSQMLSGELKPPDNLCLILDESSQVDTLELAETLDLVAGCGAKLILVGDDRQLGSVRYGGMFATLFAKLGGARLTETRRAASAWDRTAQAHLRMGDLKEALRIYEQDGRITVCDGQLALVESVRNWLDKEFASGTDSFVITNTKKEEVMANSLAKAAWQSHRRQWVESYIDAQVRHHRMSPAAAESRRQKLADLDPRLALSFSGSKVELQLGDLVAVRQSLKTDKGQWLRNGQRGRVVDITDKFLTLFVEDESSARHVKIAVDAINRRPGSISYGWASTVYRTQSMELGSSEKTLAITDEPSDLVPGTPVEVRKSTHRSKTFTAEFLEFKEDKATIRIKNGKVRTVAKSRISLSEETKNQLNAMIAEARDGNALVLGTEGMNLDSLLVSASRARQRTDFLFRSIKATENDLGTEKLLENASPKELAKATLTLYVARQSQPEQPDSAYLRLAREREAIALAATVDLELLGALRLWLADNLTSGVLDITVDRDNATDRRAAAMARMAQIEEQMSATDNPEVMAHLLGEAEACETEIDYTRRELARLEVFGNFIGHAEGALSDKTGQVVVDERYVNDRISLVDEAIAMAEDKGSWTEIPEAILVPLPENTAREVVDVSAKEHVKLNTSVKLFSNVSYRVASRWMELADALYDKALAEHLSPDQAIANLDISDEDKIRLREAFAAVAVNRAHPTAVEHPVTLRGIRDETLEEGVDPGLVAAVERLTESLDDRANRRAEKRSAEDFQEFDDEDYDDAPEGYEESNSEPEVFFVPGEEAPMFDDDDFYDDSDDYDAEPGVPGTQPVANQSEERSAAAVSEDPANEHAEEERWVGFFCKGADGIWRADADRQFELRQSARQKLGLTASYGPSDLEERIERAFTTKIRREIPPGSGEFYDPVLDEGNPRYMPEMTKELREEQFDDAGRVYAGGFFYRDADGIWCVDHQRRDRLASQAHDIALQGFLDGDTAMWSFAAQDRRHELLDITKRRPVSLNEDDPYHGEIYDPQLDAYTSALNAARKRLDAEIETEEEERARLDPRMAYGTEQRMAAERAARTESAGFDADTEGPLQGPSPQPPSKVTKRGMGVGLGF